jgi:murein DD-endopeptidase MepM/ murein hydrolase activator NlpD
MQRVMAAKHRINWKGIAVGLAAVTFTPAGYAANQPLHNDVDEVLSRVADPRQTEEPLQDAGTLTPPEAVLPSLRSAPAPQEGHSREQLVSAPLDQQFRMTSRFGWRRSRRTGERTFHAGMDFGAPRGTAVRAIRGGTVEMVTRDSERRNGMSGYGNAVVIHDKVEDLWFLYAHLSETSVEHGAQVEAGQVIGAVGNSSNGRFRGMATHLHLEVRERTARGESPFPGPYRRHNIDPQGWLAQHGVAYDRRGRLQDASPETNESEGTVNFQADATPRAARAELIAHACWQSQSGMCVAP